MILNNMLAIIESACLGSNSSDYIGGSFPMRGSGDQTGAYISARNSFNLFTTTTDYYGLMGNLGIVLGTGTAEPTLDDYIITDAKIVDINAASQCACMDGVQTYTVNYTNSTDADITFTEIGLERWIGEYYWSLKPFRYVRNTPGTNSAFSQVFPKSSYMLLTRDLLDTPVIVKAGETYTFTYKLDLSKLATSAE